MLKKLKKMFKTYKELQKFVDSEISQAILITETNISDFEPPIFFSGEKIKINDKLIYCALVKEDNSLEIIRVNVKELDKIYEIIEDFDYSEAYFLHVKFVKS